MRIKKMLKLLKKATEERSSFYSEEELEYMKNQLHIIEVEILKLEHKNYKGFGKKYETH